ncbi:MAG: hypothetical protein CV087_15160 [Candidatus Brocadia sp. WS118]|nr:MAG: hypothetical protein CV087_15160 [Candidatus Brocadia sp. WS118]
MALFAFGRTRVGVTHEKVFVKRKRFSAAKNRRFIALSNENYDKVQNIYSIDRTHIFKVSVTDNTSK